MLAMEFSAIRHAGKVHAGDGNRGELPREEVLLSNLLDDGDKKRSRGEVCCNLSNSVQGVVVQDERSEMCVRVKKKKVNIYK